MAGLTGLALVSVVGQPDDHETWSLLASKLIVPLALFHLAGLVFTDERRFRQFEIFALVVLAYLSFTAIAFLCGAHSLIFPKFILDASFDSMLPGRVARCCKQWRTASRSTSWDCWRCMPTAGVASAD